MNGVIVLNKGSCRDELLSTIRNIVKLKGINEFTLKEAVVRMLENKTVYKESTIRTHIVSKCCINSNRNHTVVFNDYERVGVGTYKLLNFS
jgi:hypothetical protein